MPRNQGTSRKGKPGKIEKAAGMGRSLLIRNKYKPRQDGKNIYGGTNGMAAIPGVTSIGVDDNGGGGNSSSDARTNNHNNNNDTAVSRKLLSTGTHPRSILDMDDLDDFLLQANLAEREFFSDRGGGTNGTSGMMPYADEPIQIIDPHRKGVQWADDPTNNSINNTTTTVMELSVPRRPPWTSDMTRDELEQQEKVAFLEWRRKIAQYEAVVQLQSSSLPSSSYSTTSMAPTTTTTTTTPFEKNIHVWKQLWRVIERSNVIIQIIDARNPLFYISHDLYQYVTQELHKPMILLFNKSDYLSRQQRQIWKRYFTSASDGQWTQNCHLVFFSAMREQKKLDVAAALERKRIVLQEQQQQRQQQQEDEEYDNAIPPDDDDDDNDDDDDDDEGVEEEEGKRTDNKEDELLTHEEPDEDEDDNISNPENDEEDDNDDADVRILTRIELIETMRRFAQQHDCQAEERYDYRIQYGMVGFPNVGKSSVINVLAGASKHTHNTVRVAVASQPGKTKHFQTVLLHDQHDIMLCDCPGLVFPSFVSNTADLIAAGVYPIAQMRDHWPVTNLVCQRIPRDILNAHYGIVLPVLSHQQLQDRGYDPSRNGSHNNCTNDALPPPTAEELLTTYCVARGLLASFSGVPDFQRGARLIIKDYADGKLLYCHPPPNMSATELKKFYSYTVQTALRNTQRTRERLLKQQQKLQLQQSTVETSKSNKKRKDSSKNAASKMTTLDAFDDDLIQMIAATTMPSSSMVTSSNQNRRTIQNNNKTAEDQSQNSHKLHYKKSAGAKWGKKDRKNRNKDPYGCHTATPDSTILSMI